MFLRITKFSLVLMMLVTSHAYAARVTQSKNNKVMIDLEGEEATIDQSIVLLNAQKKRVALGKILQVKNGKAVASITKGKAAGNETVQLGAASSGQPTSADPRTSSKVRNMGRTSAKRGSVVLNFLNNSMSTLQSDSTLPTPNTETVAMKGTSFGVTGVLDWPIFKKVVLRGTLGYEPFTTTGTAKFNSCDNQLSKNCTANITYISTGGYVRYDFTQSDFVLWGGVGGTMKFPMAKSTTALRSDDIKMTMTYGAAFGMDYFLSKNYFIPASFELQYFLKSDTVDANIMLLRVGYGMVF